MNPNSVEQFTAFYLAIVIAPFAIPVVHRVIDVLMLLPRLISSLATGWLARTPGITRFVDVSGGSGPRTNRVHG